MTASMDSKPSPASPQVDHESRYHRVYDRDNVIVEFWGRQIGYASSLRDVHAHDAGTETHPIFTNRGERCSACRWFEVRIFVVDHAYTDDCTCDVRATEANPDPEHDHDCGQTEREGRYLTATYGMTIVPGETPKRRCVWTDSPYRVLEVLTQRNHATTFIPSTSAHALAEAAGHDSGIRDAYLNRATP